MSLHASPRNPKEHSQRPVSLTHVPWREHSEYSAPHMTTLAKTSGIKLMWLYFENEHGFFIRLSSGFPP